MQPYFFPYLGYFQLVAAVDRFVILDDVAFPRAGWVHRNRLPIGGAARWFGVPIAGASQNRRIDDLMLAPHGTWRRKLVRTLEVAYARAPHGDDTRAWFTEQLRTHERLIDLLEATLTAVRDRLGLTTVFVRASSAHPRGSARAQERILEICRREGARSYLNPPGGRALYDPAAFAGAGIDLAFLRPTLDAADTDPNGGAWSILDALMTRDRATLRAAARAGSIEAA